MIPIPTPDRLIDPRLHQPNRAGRGADGGRFLSRRARASSISASSVSSSPRRSPAVICRRVKALAVVLEAILYGGLVARLRSEGQDPLQFSPAWIAGAVVALVFLWAPRHAETQGALAAEARDLYMTNARSEARPAAYIRGPSPSLIWKRIDVSEYKKYRRVQIAELRPYVPGEVLSDRVSISAADRDAGSPKLGDMIARNPDHHDDEWLVAADYFAANFEPVENRSPARRSAAKSDRR